MKFGILRNNYLSILLITALPAAVPALDYSYVTNNGAITITKYLGPGGDIIIPESINGLPVTTIGNRLRTPEWSAWDVAFVNRDNLTSITIPDSVTTIGQAEFRYCKGLINVTIGSGVTHIDEMAFSCCRNLTDIAVDEQNPAFSSLDGILFDKNKTRLVKCPRSKTADFVIPNSVTAIGGFAFEGSINRTSIAIPDGVTYIGTEAFSGWRRLTNITLPDSVTFLGNEAFGHCYDLTRITIPDRVTSIGNKAFNTSGLTHITIGSGVTNIGERAFWGCDNLLTITVDEQNPAFSSFDGALLNKNQTTLIKCPIGKTDSFVIPDTVTTIGDSSIHVCTNRTDVIIPDGVTFIGAFSFAYWADLTSVTIPDRVTFIGNEAFRGCQSLTNVTLGANVTSIGDDAFAYCSPSANSMFAGEANDNPPTSGLASITIPANCSAIGTDAFNRCDSLTNISVNAPNSSFSAIDGVLYNHDRIELLMCPQAKTGHLIIPDGVRTISDSAFKGCTQLTSITVPDSVRLIGNCAFLNCSGLSSITIGSGVTTIGNQAFRGCKRLTHITLPGQVTTIEPQTFKSCWKLKSVEIPEGVTSIGDGAFKSCLSLTNVTLPEGVGFIGPETFSYCKKLPRITIPHHVTLISPKTFEHCEQLSDITIPEGVTSIGHGAFRNCRSLSSITLPVGVTTIENEVFSGCSRLWSVTIPDRITSIGKAAFASCGRLRSITIPDSTISIGKEAFKECGSLSFIIIPDGITTIEAGTFASCFNLVGITLPQTVTSIRKEAFSYCRRLTRLNIPKGVMFIGNGAFQGTGLKAITIPDGMTFIPDHVFSWCALTNITIPASVASIGDKAFYSCHYLDLVFFEGNAPSLGNSVFERTSPGIYYRPGTIGWGDRFGDRPTALHNPKYPDYAYTTTNDSITITRYFGTGGDISIPSIIDELPVTSIGSLWCRNLISLNIPHTVTTIAYDMLWGCANLTNITVDPLNPNYSSKDGVLFDKSKAELIKCQEGKSGEYAIPEGVRTIGRSAFNKCGKLTHVTIPDSVATIGIGAFSDCTNLTHITIPNSVTNIEAFAFGRCTRLTNAVLPDSITTMKDGAFTGCTSLESIVIPSALTTIQSRMFSDCSSLMCIAIPDTITSIEYNAFRGCSRLNSITIPSGITSIENGLFSGCANLISITIPDDITIIGPYAFSGCRSLANITIPNSVTNIGKHAFGGANLASIDVDPLNPVFSSVDGVLYDKDKTKIIKYPEGKAGSIHILGSISDIGRLPYRRSHLSDFEVDPHNPAFSSFDGILYDKDQTTLIDIPGSKTGRLYIPANTISFRQHYTSSRYPGRFPSRFAFDDSPLTDIAVDEQNPAFSSLDGVLYDKNQTTLLHCLRAKVGVVHIPASVTNIMSSAFSTCNHLTAISVNKQNAAYSSFDGLLYDKKKTELIKCPEGKTGSIVLPATVTRIRDRQFSRCNYFTEIAVDTNNTSFSSHDGALLNRSQTSLLKCPKGKVGSYTIPDSVYSIAYNAFSGCTNLTTITFGNNVTRIGSGAFSGCSSLTSITIPDTVTDIGGGAFGGCANLKSVYFEGHAPIADKSSGDRIIEPQFLGNNKATIYYLPENSGWGETYCRRPTALWKRPE